MTWPRISLRAVLIAINLTVLLLPLAGIQLMRLYESALVRQTESALIAQAAFVAAAYRAAAEDIAGLGWQRVARHDLSEAARRLSGSWRPRYAELDLATSSVLAPFPDGVEQAPEHDLWSRVGRRIHPMLKDAQLVTLAGIRVVDPDGVIVASTGNDLNQSIAHGEEVEVALRGEYASRLRRKLDQPPDTALNSISRGSRVRVFVTSPILMQEQLIGAVMLSRTPPSIGQALYGKRWLLLQGLSLLLILVLLMSWMTFRLIARPITRLADHASQISQSAATTQQTLSALQEHSPRSSEVARLQEAIVDMANTLEQRAAYLQDFARHVSHEFKTPLAGIRGAVEVLQDHSATMSAEEQQRFLNNVSEDAARLDRLTRRLMELTKAEMHTGSRHSVTLKDAVDAAVHDYRDRVTFECHVAEDATVETDPDALSAVLDVLFENAMQQAATNIRISTSEDNEQYKLHVVDNGPGISEGNRSRIFTPFFTTQRQHGGTGLGLTIAKALIQRADGDLQLAEASSGDGAQFDICLKRAA